MTTLSALRDEAERMMRDAPTGEPLRPADAALIAFGACLSVTSLHGQEAARHAQQARASGASTEQLQEALLLVSGLGVHSLFVGLALLDPTPEDPADALLDDPHRAGLWSRWVGSDTYWDGFERAVPGFLQRLLQASPDGFDAFFRYCAVPWKTRHLPALTKELIALACDTTPSHRFGPGMRLHLSNALALGAGRLMLQQVLDIAGAVPPHPGTA